MFLLQQAKPPSSKCVKIQSTYRMRVGGGCRRSLSDPSLRIFARCSDWHGSCERSRIANPGVSLFFRNSSHDLVITSGTLRWLSADVRLSPSLSESFGDIVDDVRKSRKRSFVAFEWAVDEADSDNGGERVLANYRESFSARTGGPKLFSTITFFEHCKAV
jgi:hypothetical protein